MANEDAVAELREYLVHLERARELTLKRNMPGGILLVPADMSPDEVAQITFLRSDGSEVLTLQGPEETLMKVELMDTSGRDLVKSLDKSIAGLKERIRRATE